MENFIDAVKEEAGHSFSTAGTTLVQSRSVAQGSDRVLCKDNRFAYKLIVPSGIFTGSDMIKVANASKKFGSGKIRLSYDQNIYVPHITKEMLEAFAKEEVITRYAKFNNLYFRDMIACAGSKTCTFGVIENKSDAIEMAEFLSSEVAIESATVRMNWSGCPKGCGVHGVADIGFEGCKAKDDEGATVDGVNIVVSGKITHIAKEARILHKALPLMEARYHVKYLLQNYAKFKHATETYEAFDDRYLNANYSFQALRFFTTINYLLNEKLGLDKVFEFEKEPKTYKKENFEVFHFGLQLFKLLTGENRYAGTEDFEPILTKPRKITKNEVSKLNPKVPLALSEAVYLMTHQDKKIRARVFSEILMLLKEV
jgi:ferredoxin-nitrite reductase